MIRQNRVGPLFFSFKTNKDNLIGHAIYFETFHFDRTETGFKLQLLGNELKATVAGQCDIGFDEISTFTDNHDSRFADLVKLLRPRIIKEFLLKLKDHYGAEAAAIEEELKKLSPDGS